MSQKDLDSARYARLHERAEQHVKAHNSTKQRALDSLKRLSAQTNLILGDGHEPVLTATIDTTPQGPAWTQSQYEAFILESPFPHFVEQCVIGVLLDSSLGDLPDAARLIDKLRETRPEFEQRLREFLKVDKLLPRASYKWVDGFLRRLAAEPHRAIVINDWRGAVKKVVVNDVVSSRLQPLFDITFAQPALKSNLTQKSSEKESPQSKRRRISSKSETSMEGDDPEALLAYKSVREQYNHKTHSDVMELLSTQTTRHREQTQKFKTKEGSAIREYCKHVTKDACRNDRNSHVACSLTHFREILLPHTDRNLGNCSYLDSCRNIHTTCKYIHFEYDPPTELELGDQLQPVDSLVKFAKPQPPQWINCDVRRFDFEVIGKVGVIMADPPWNIHMELPYGTMSDDEMRGLNVQCLQDHGLFFLWVTGRAMELGRELFQLWGYERVAEIVWIKTNQLQRMIRTGRTGHWLNHTKEHCLVGIKGNPKLNRALDCDVVVSRVRETSRKPDEIYSLIERLSPNTPKLEIFGRQHNCRPGWITLGNQLQGTNIVDKDLKARFDSRYPSGSAE